MHLSPHPSIPVASAAVRSVVVYLMLVVALVVFGALCLVLVLLFSTLCPSSFVIILMEKREQAAFL